MTTTCQAIKVPRPTLTTAANAATKPATLLAPTRNGLFNGAFIFAVAFSL
jgi:hypothetical protein